MIIEDHKEQKWIDYSEDESYLINYIDGQKFEDFTDENGEIIDAEKLIDFTISDWKGIYQKLNGKQKPLKCELRNKILVFDKSPDRWAFILSKSLDYKTFFDMEKYRKN